MGNAWHEGNSICIRICNRTAILHFHLSLGLSSLYSEEVFQLSSTSMDMSTISIISKTRTLRGLLLNSWTESTIPFLRGQSNDSPFCCIMISKQWCFGHGKEIVDALEVLKHQESLRFTSLKGRCWYIVAVIIDNMLMQADFLHTIVCCGHFSIQSHHFKDMVIFSRL